MAHLTTRSVRLCRRCRAFADARVRLFRYGRPPQASQIRLFLALRCRWPNIKRTERRVSWSCHQGCHDLTLTAGAPTRSDHAWPFSACRAREAHATQRLKPSGSARTSVLLSHRRARSFPSRHRSPSAVSTAPPLPMNCAAPIRIPHRRPLKHPQEHAKQSLDRRSAADARLTLPLLPLAPAIELSVSIQVPTVRERGAMQATSKAPSAAARRTGGGEEETRLSRTQRRLAHRLHVASIASNSPSRALSALSAPDSQLSWAAIDFATAAQSGSAGARTETRHMPACKLTSSRASSEEASA